jgi:hypothetical protein
MIKKIIFIIPIIFAVSFITAQEITGFVFNKESSKPVKYANVKIKNSNRGTYVNGKGQFRLKAEQNDTLLISCIGFNNQFFPVSLFNSGDTLYLNPRSYIIPEVMVSNKSKTREIGYLKEKTKLYHVFPAFEWGTEFVCYISNNISKNCRILSVFFKAQKGKAESVIRLHIYKPLSSGKPGEELLQEDILVTSSEISKGKLEINLTNHNIIFPENGVFVGLELIGYENYNAIRNDLNKKNNKIIEIGLINTVDSKCFTKFIFDDNSIWERVYNSKAVIENFGSPLSYQIGLLIQDIQP